MPTASRGFVLPSVLLVLILFTAVALAAATLATMQARMSGDFQVSSAALQAAEGGASFVVNGFADGSLEWLPDGVYEGAELEGVAADLPAGLPQVPNHGLAAWWVESMDFAGELVTIRVRGEIPQRQAWRAIEVVFARGEGGSTSPFAGAVVACDGVEISGSGRIDSWDSSQGPYSPATAGQGASVMTLDPGADVTLSGSSPIRGNVFSARDIRLSGSASISGSIQAVRNIQFNGNPACPVGAVQAGGSVSAPGAWWLNGCGNPEFDEGANVQLPTQPCDPLDVPQMIADSMAAHAPPSGSYASWPHTGWRPNPVQIASDTALASFSIGPGAHPVTIDAGAVNTMFVNGNFSLTSSAILHITNPSVTGAVPQRLRIYVNGDLTAVGASQLRIDPGVAVEFYVTGRVNFAGGHGQTIPPTVNLNPNGTPEIVPTLSIYSSWVGGGPGNQPGVSVGGSSPLSASVYAPLATVAVAGSSSLYGAVRGRTVRVSGAAAIHYDEALGLMGGVTGGGSTAPRVMRWQEVR